MNIKFKDFENFLIELNQNKKYIELFSYNDLDRYNETKYSVYSVNHKLNLKVINEFFSFNIDHSFNFYIEKNKIKIVSNGLSIYIPFDKDEIEKLLIIDFFIQIINYFIIKNSQKEKFQL